MKSITKIAAATAFVLTASGCALQPNDNTLPGQVAVGDDGYTVSVHFDKVENLVPNSQVLKDNVVIGTVAAIDVEDWEAVVKLRLLDDVPLSSRSVFAIGQKTLLGAQYVEVRNPDEAIVTRSNGETGPLTNVADIAGTADTSGDVLEDGDVIGVEQTGTYPATEQVLGAVALLLNNGGLSQISTITGELSTALHDRTPDTRDLIRKSNELLGVLDANRSDIIRALESLNRLSAGLANDRTRIARAIDRITPGLKSLNEERDRLVAAVTATGRTGVRAGELIQVSQEALLANLDSLEPILGNLGKVSRQLPEALKIGLTIPFPVMTSGNALKGDYANLFATLDLRGSSLADSFLGLDIPALQANDPVLGPLQTQDDAQDSAQSDTGDKGRKGPKNDNGTGATPGTGGSDGDSGDPSCLLHTLGVC